MVNKRFLVTSCAIGLALGVASAAAAAPTSPRGLKARVLYIGGEALGAGVNAAAPSAARVTTPRFRVKLLYLGGGDGSVSQAQSSDRVSKPNFRVRLLYIGDVGGADSQTLPGDNLQQGGRARTGSGEVRARQ